MKRTILLTISLVLGVSSFAFTQSLVEGLQSVIDEHPDLASAQAEYSATEERRDGKFRDSWLPNLDVTYRYGTQHYNPADGESSDETPQEFSARVEQLLTDFGESNSQIAADSFSVQQKKARLEVVKERLLIDGLDVFIQVQKAKKLIEYADQSVENILKQTQMENMLVAKGRGYSSNVLQAKTQLAGARARQNKTNSDLDVAMSGVYAIYNEAADYLNFGDQLTIPESFLPASVDEAVDVALAENPNVKVGAFRSKTLSEKIHYEKARNFYPNLAVVGEVNRDQDLDGTLGTKRDDRVMLELSYPLNIGLSGLNHSKAARKDLRASEKAEQSVLREIERSVRVAWRNNRTAKENIILLENKVNIAGEFLRLAKEERKAGRRTLLDVLAAETTLVNSQSELAAARAESLISAYSLIYSMGRLDLGVIAGTVDSVVTVKEHAQPVLASVSPSSKDVPAVQEQDKSISNQEPISSKEQVVDNGFDQKGGQEVAVSVADVAVVKTEVSNTPLSVSDNKPELQPSSLFNLTVGCKGGSNEIVSSDKEQLKKLSDRVLSTSGARLQIYGYTSSKKNSPANLKLSIDRAAYVKELLVGYGVAKEQMMTVGKGNQNPISSNETTSGRKQNRRVEIFVFADDATVADLAVNQNLQL